MICKDFKDFPRKGRLLGIDWGARRMGLAVSDPEQKFAFTRPHIDNEPRTANREPRLLKIIADEDIVGIVVGLPLFFDGSESDTTRRVRAFADDLATQTDLPIIFQDETLTSVEAAESHPADLDSESARIILEQFIIHNA
ncbi:MAG: Holliday junction resolvase RuvX [Rickettsiales bacterium]|nr:Holliday junction resolvase RuvX [Rickettsiales bacterium]